MCVIFTGSLPPFPFSFPLSFLPLSSSFSFSLALAHLLLSSPLRCPRCCSHRHRRRLRRRLISPRQWVRSRGWVHAVPPRGRPRPSRGGVRVPSSTPTPDHCLPKLLRPFPLFRCLFIVYLYTFRHVPPQSIQAAPPGIRLFAHSLPARTSLRASAVMPTALPGIGLFAHKVPVHIWPRLHR